MTSRLATLRVRARISLALIIASGAAVVCGGHVLLALAWNSLEDVSTAHRFFQVAKWSFAVLAVTMELGSLYSGSRKERLQREQAAKAVAEATAAVDAKYAHRRLTQTQKLALKEILSKHPPPASPIQIHSVSGDAESASFGIHLAQAITEAGWPAVHENMAFFGAPHGLQVRVEGMVEDPVDVADTDEASCRPCSVLARGLTHAGQPTKVMIWPRTDLSQPPKPAIELVVGYKPLPNE